MCLTRAVKSTAHFARRLWQPCQCCLQRLTALMQKKRKFQFFKLFTSLKSVAPSKQFFHVSLMLLEKMDKKSVKDLGKT